MERVLQILAILALAYITMVVVGFMCVFAYQLLSDRRYRDDEKTDKP
jgi:hypothetical protein